MLALAKGRKDDKARVKHLVAEAPALHRAVHIGHLVVVQMLLEAFGDDKASLLKVADGKQAYDVSNEATALWIATRWKHTEIVDLLRKHGATKEE